MRCEMNRYEGLIGMRLTSISSPGVEKQDFPRLRAMSLARVDDTGCRQPKVSFVGFVEEKLCMPVCLQEPPAVITPDVSARAADLPKEGRRLNSGRRAADRPNGHIEADRRTFPVAQGTLQRCLLPRLVVKHAHGHGYNSE